MNLRKICGGIVLAGVVSTFGTVANAQSVTDATSAHNLAQGNTATTQVCVFCHTPHGSDTSAPAPLWNKVLGTAGMYGTRYSSLGTTTLDGTEAPVGSVSLACLSCHDGTQAVDTVLNLPGSNGWSATGTEISTTEQGAITTTPVRNLGTDLSNDHPVSIQYAGGGITTGSGTVNTNIAAAGNFGDLDFRPVRRGDDVNSQPIWWVNTTGGADAVREKTDMFLYTRNFGGQDQPFVECGSCHDPHNAASAPVQFLRIDNDASAVCTACHVK